MVTLGVLFVPNALVAAQEITPDPDAYDFGSTSEFAESELLTQGADVPDPPAPSEENPTASVGGDDSAEDLADTGQPIIYIVAGAVVLIGGSTLAYQKRLRA